jgi:hypothetical protein
MRMLYSNGPLPCQWKFPPILSITNAFHLARWIDDRTSRKALIDRGLPVLWPSARSTTPLFDDV